jgi:hypothetical protein
MIRRLYLRSTQRG